MKNPTFGNKLGPLTWYCDCDVLGVTEDETAEM